MKVECEKIFRRVDDKEVLDESYKQAMTVMKTCFVVNLFPLFLGESTSLLINKTVMPTYIPKNWMEFEQQPFFFIRAGFSPLSVNSNNDRFFAAKGYDFLKRIFEISYQMCRFTIET